MTPYPEKAGAQGGPNNWSKYKIPFSTGQMAKLSMDPGSKGPPNQKLYQRVQGHKIKLYQRVQKKGPKGPEF